MHTVTGLIEALRGTGDRDAKLAVLRGSGFEVDQKSFRGSTTRRRATSRRATCGSPTRAVPTLYPGQMVNKEEYEKERLRIANLKDQRQGAELQDARPGGWRPFATRP